MPVTREGAGQSTAIHPGTRRLRQLLPCRGWGATPGDRRTGSQDRGRRPQYSMFLFGRPNGALRSSSSASQSGSRRPQALSYVKRRPASVVPGEGHIGRRLATSGGWVELIWEQEAAGSNPAIPTTTFRICYQSLGARPVGGCRLMAVGVAQHMCTLAPAVKNRG
jgi:hypothetical protein